MPRKLEEILDEKGGLPTDTLKRIQEIGESTPTIKEILLFGSRSRNEAKKTSDVDLLVIVENTAPLLQLYQEFEEARQNFPNTDPAKKNGWDVLIHTESIAREGVNLIGRIEPEVAKDGITLYARDDTPFFASLVKAHGNARLLHDPHIENIVRQTGFVAAQPPTEISNLIIAMNSCRIARYATKAAIANGREDALESLTEEMQAIRDEIPYYSAHNHDHYTTAHTAKVIATADYIIETLKEESPSNTILATVWENQGLSKATLESVRSIKW